MDEKTTLPAKVMEAKGELMTMDPWRLAEVLAKSGFFRDSRQAAQAAVKVIAGREMGIGPIAAMTGIHVVVTDHGTSIQTGANLMAQMIKTSGRYDYKIIEHTEKVCEIEFYRLADGKAELIDSSRFTIEDAEKQELVKPKSNWVKVPRNMLFARAMSNGFKWYTPDASQGVPVYAMGEVEEAEFEEIGDSGDKERASLKDRIGRSKEKKNGNAPADDNELARKAKARKGEQEAKGEQEEESQAAAEPETESETPEEPGAAKEPHPYKAFLETCKAQRQKLGDAAYYGVLGSFEVEHANKIKPADTETQERLVEALMEADPGAGQDENGSEAAGGNEDGTLTKKDQESLLLLADNYGVPVSVLLDEIAISHNASTLGEVPAEKFDSLKEFIEAQAGDPKLAV